MAGKPFQIIDYCEITKKYNVQVLVPYVDSDKDSSFRTYGLSTGVDIAAEGYIYAAIFGSVIDICPTEDSKSKIITIQYSEDEIVRYSGLYEVYVHIGDSLVPSQSVGSVHDKLHIEYATAWKKNSRWSIKLLRKVWYKQDPMMFVDGTYSNRDSTSDSLEYFVPPKASSEYSGSKLIFISEAAGSVIKYSKSYGISLNSPIIAQVIVESDWGQSNMAKENKCYFVKLKDKTFESMDDCIKSYFIYINKNDYSRIKGMKDPKAFVQSLVDCGYYPNGSKYPNRLINTIDIWNLTQFDGISSNLSQPDSRDDINDRNHIAYSKDTNQEYFSEIQNNER